MDVLARELVKCAAPALGRRICHWAVVGPTMARLREGIPENGIGEEVAERRKALQYLESVCGACKHSTKCWHEELRAAE